MRQANSIKGGSWGYCLLLIALLAFITRATAQQSITINMSPIDGVTLTPGNVLNYQVYATVPENVVVTGVIRYRNSDMSMSYSYNYSLRTGMNVPGTDMVTPHWQFSTPALHDLFFTYNILPAGTYEYCVTITPVNTVVEKIQNLAQECLYRRNNDLFLINLVDPADKAKIKEFNPMLSWVANYSFASELTYRIRVAEIKQGQNTVNAVMRNQPAYDEKSLMQNNVVYPVYARPLVANQPYAWTVDAYYKNILLGGAESWQFIITDTQVTTGSANPSYVDIKRESGLTELSAIGNLKLKYVLDDAQSDTLALELINDKGKKCSFSPTKLNGVYGDNRYTIDLAGTANLKHKAMYTLVIKTKTRHEYKLSFLYLNPDLQR